MTKLSRFLSSLVFLLTLCAAICSAQTQPTTQHTIVLHAARLLDVKSGRVVKPGEVLVQGDQIVEVGASVKHPAGAEVIDLGRCV